jgi:hypothetical protein
MCYFVFFVYCIVLCIVVPLPPGTYPLAVNINNNNFQFIRSHGLRTDDYDR